MKETKTIGARYRFTYPNYGTPETHPDYREHSNQIVTIERQLTNNECDPECQPSYLVKADDGWVGTAHASELHKVKPETLLPADVYKIVQELRSADYHAVGQEFFNTRVERLKAAGWVLGITAFSDKKVKGNRGHTLRTPRNEWRNIAYFYHPEQQVKVWYWDNLAKSKEGALRMASNNPPPAGNYEIFQIATHRLHMPGKL